MQFDDLRIFVATVEAGSFTGAADKLLLSKQFVSRRVMALEASLGVRLLVRNTRKLAVTELGQEFHSRATRILAEIADTEEAMSARRRDLRGTLKLSAPMSFGITHLSPLIAEFLVQHPAVRLHLELSDRHVDLIGEGFDLALRIGALPDSTLIARRLGELRMVACCGPAYRRSRGAPATPADLHRHTCLLYGQEGRTGWEFVIDGARRTFEVQGALLANNGDVIRDAAVAGLGIALLPHFIVAPALDAGTLVTVLEPFAQSPLPVNAVYPQHRQDMAACRVFLGFIEERLRKRFSE
ncbi:LysR family transcriptional regulator [Burkholderia mayonis]|uniref:LysR family transcriptional regulator n=1 Tax=Burkholderia mayonis TaxID=1385591 RepID=A0A1B4FV61_9BURK|nr:LysR family transcriptional regulator [Burkholderia mayonis]AOJ07542.1 LysR family transcriptional regulator [Burkholderia mayonis]KVE50894.1 LysR family transcriptional regulator [Burkholderia mayonis]